jgi:hypothetical protein
MNLQQISWEFSMKRLIISACFFIASVSASASLGLQTGTYVPYAFKAQSSSDGGTQKLAINPFLSMSYRLRLTNRFMFAPELGYVLHTGNEDNTSTRTIFLLYTVTTPIHPAANLRFGLGTFHTRVSGDGGTVTLNDGGATQDFFVPEEGQTSVISTVNLGGELFFNRQWGMRLDGAIMTPLSSTRRKFSYLLSLNYRLGSL